MEIQHIKSNLTLSQILHHYGLKPKNNMLNCPFHEDKTASLQVNLEKHFYKCHACGAKGDQIQWVQDYEKLSKREAILKCAEMVGSSPLTPKGGTPIGVENKNTIDINDKIKFLEKLFTTFKKSVYNSKPAQDYLQSRNLDFKKIVVGYNGGQFHHGTRKEETLIKQALEYGLLIDNNLKEGYNVFGKYGIVFPLKNQENQIVSLYFRSTLDKQTDKGGSLNTNENKSVVKQNAKHFYLKNRQGLYPNYPNPETKRLILTESIIDCASLLQIDEVIKNHSVLACFGTNGLNEEIQKAILELTELEEIIFAFDNDDAGKEAVKKYAEQFKQYKISTIELPNKDINETLQLHEPEIFIELLEQRKSPLTPEWGTLNIVKNETKKPILTTKSGTPPSGVGGLDFLKAKELLKRLNVQIGKSGIVGEENSRLLLFLIIISYMNKNPIHGIVQGSSGSGKTHIIGSIADLMPGEDVLRFTRITESSLYNWGEFDLFRKIIIIEDLDGLKEEALYALRELISNQFLSSSVSMKDKKGNNKSTRKEVKGQFSSLSATTKGETYEDNMNRSFVLAVDESEAQTTRIIDYQNKKITGEINSQDKQKAIGFIQSIVRSLKYYEVQNAYATQLQLPDNVRNKRRLNEMIQSVIKQITIVNQYQRKQTKDGKLITEIEDIENAVEILFESIILKIDELDGSSRQFFEKLKKVFKDNDFNRFSAMEKTGFKKTQLQFYLNELVRLEYLKQTGFHNKGFKYKITYLDNNQQIRTELKSHFNKQLESLKRTLANATEH
jgi:DNA primase